MKAVLIRTVDDLTAIEPQWWSLWARSESATPFQSPAWLLPWWHAFSPGAVCTVAVLDGDHLVGLAPFYLESSTKGRRLLPIGISVSDFHDILQEGDRADVANLIRDCLMREDWNTWEISELAPGAAALLMDATVDFRVATHIQSATPILSLDQDISRSVPSRKLRKLRMARHRANRREGFSIYSSDASSLLSDFSTLVRLHSARWHNQDGTGVLTDRRVVDFHRAALPALFGRGLVEFYTLSLDGRAAGCYYGLSQGARRYAYLGGFDPAYAFESPGTLLIGHAIEQAARNGAREFNFLRGREAYKYEWGAIDRWNCKRTFERVSNCVYA